MDWVQWINTQHRQVEKQRYIGKEAMGGWCYIGENKECPTEAPQDPGKRLRQGFADRKQPQISEHGSLLFYPLRIKFLRISGAVYRWLCFKHVIIENLKSINAVLVRYMRPIENYLQRPRRKRKQTMRPTVLGYLTPCLSPAEETRSRLRTDLYAADGAWWGHAGSHRRSHRGHRGTTSRLLQQ